MKYVTLLLQVGVLYVFSLVGMDSGNIPSINTGKFNRDVNTVPVSFHSRSTVKVV